MLRCLFYVHDRSMLMLLRCVQARLSHPHRLSPRAWRPWRRTAPPLKKWAPARKHASTHPRHNLISKDVSDRLPVFIAATSAYRKTGRLSRSPAADQTMPSHSALGTPEKSAATTAARKARRSRTLRSTPRSTRSTRRCEYTSNGSTAT